MSCDLIALAVAASRTSGRLHAVIKQLLRSFAVELVPADVQCRGCNYVSEIAAQLGFMVLEQAKAGLELYLMAKTRQTKMVKEVEQAMRTHNPQKAVATLMRAAARLRSGNVQEQITLGRRLSVVAKRLSLPARLAAELTEACNVRGWDSETLRKAMTIIRSLSDA